MREQTIVPVILCGGSGTRLWPVSREDAPKQFLNIIGDFSLLQNTLLRARSLPNINNIVIVTTAAIEPQVRDQVLQIDGTLTRHIIVEPFARNTAPAIALAAAYVLKHFGPDAVLCIMPSDHHIADRRVFQDSVAKGFALASDRNIITFGIKPISPHTEYGYMITGDLHSPNALHVRQFREKPPLEDAKILHKQDNTFWNSGIFMLTLQSALHHFRTHTPDLYHGIMRSPDTLETAYKACASLSFDHEIMEKSANVLVIPADLQWTDIGSWESIWNIHPKDEQQNVLIGRTACLDSEGCFVQSLDRLIAVSGLKDIVVVETEDAIFVSPKKDAALHKKLAQHISQTKAAEPKGADIWSVTGKMGPEYVNILAHQPFEPRNSRGIPDFYIVLEGTADYAGRTYGNHELLIFLPSAKDSIKSVGSTPLKLLKVSMSLPAPLSPAVDEVRHAS